MEAKKYDFNHSISDIQPVTQNIPNGPISAAILASGIGTMVYGIFVVIAEIFKPVGEFLIFSESVGPLSGKTTLGVIIWLTAWGVTHFLWRKKEINFDKVIKLSLIFIALGLLFTFPPFYQLFLE